MSDSFDNWYDVQYKEVLRKILDNGTFCEDRTGVGVTKIFDVNISFDHSRYEDKVLPALTLRKVNPRTAFYELLWMLSGNTNTDYLKNRNISIWDGNSSREFLDDRGLHHVKEGDIGSGYGQQFRNFNGIDQLRTVIDSIKQNPNSRRHLISLWNPNQINQMALPCCHFAYQFCVIGDTLNLKFSQRSQDFILAASNNFMFSSFFLHVMSEMTGLTAGVVSHSIADCHIYENHMEVARELLEKDSKSVATFDWDFDLYNEDIDNFLNKAEWDNVSIHYQHSGAVPRSKLIMAV